MLQSLKEFFGSGEFWCRTWSDDILAEWRQSFFFKLHSFGVFQFKEEDDTSDTRVASAATVGRTTGHVTDTWPRRLRRDVDQKIKK